MKIIAILTLILTLTNIVIKTVDSDTLLEMYDRTAGWIVSAIWIIAFLIQLYY